MTDPVGFIDRLPEYRSGSVIKEILTMDIAEVVRYPMTPECGKVGPVAVSLSSATKVKDG